MQENKPVLIIGLGNPGSEYVKTRHNVGFMALDALAGDDATWRSEKNALTTRVDVDGRRVILAKPQTYMNNSGTAVLALMTFYKVPLENLIVIHDDMDIAVGNLREKVGGGSAGHNGIKSIDANVGRDYRRIRIGINHPRDFDLKMDASDWVLGRFTDEELKKINTVISEIQI